MFFKERVDDDYINLLEEKINNYNKNKSPIYDEIVDVDTLLNIARYLDKLKPKSKYREYKIKILEFLNVLENNTTLDKKQVVAEVHEYLSGLFILLKSKHSFCHRGTYPVLQPRSWLIRDRSHRSC